MAVHKEYTSYRLPVPALLPELLTLPMELELREPAGEPIAENKNRIFIIHLVQCKKKKIKTRNFSTKTIK